jgi:hypothetical protein
MVKINSIHNLKHAVVNVKMYCLTNLRALEYRKLHLIQCIKSWSEMVGKLVSSQYVLKLLKLNVAVYSFFFKTIPRLYLSSKFSFVVTARLDTRIEWFLFTKCMLLLLMSLPEST